MTDYDNANQTMCYTYDAYNRLHKAHTRGDVDCAAGYDGTVGANPVNHTYGYDTVGRFQSMTGIGAYSYHSTRRFRLTGAGGWTYGYDQAGNVTGRDNGTTVDQSLTWDMLGRVESVVHDVTGDDSVLWYDADGNRVARVDNGAVQVGVDGVFDWSSAGGFTWYYRHGGEAIGYRTSAGVSWVFSDRQGSVVAVRDPGGVVHRRRYLPYGRLRGTSSVSTEFGYTSQRLDPSGLMDYHARLYDPWIGRFISPDTIVADPANPHDLNRYSYTRNNPVMYTDPTGHVVTEGEPVYPCFSSFCRKDIRVAHRIGGRQFIQEPGYGLTPVDSYMPAMPKGTDMQLLGAIWNGAWELSGAADITGCIGGSASDCAWTAAGLFPFSRALRWARYADEAATVTKGTPAELADDVAGMACRTNSFVPGTLVLMADGSTKPIEDVEIGARVWATNPETGETGARQVVDTIVGEGAKQLVDVELEGDKVTATDGHPFWVDDQGRWVDAGDLEPGDRLLLADGSTAAVTAVDNRSDVLHVHNLTVEGIHTYYVEVGGEQALVHNQGGPCLDAIKIAQHADEAGNVIPGVDDLAQYVDDVLKTTGTDITRGRTVWWDPTRGAVVIRESDGYGTVFVPDRGYDYYLDLLAE